MSNENAVAVVETGVDGGFEDVSAAAVAPAVKGKGKGKKAEVVPQGDVKSVAGEGVSEGSQSVRKSTGEFLRVDPSTLVVKKGENHSRWAQDEITETNDKVRWLAWNMWTHGRNDVAVGVSREGESLVVQVGFHRLVAAMLIRKGFDYKGRNEEEGIAPVRVHDPEFMLTVEVLEGSEEALFLANIDENVSHTPLSPMDQAQIARDLRNKFGWNDARIARRLDCDTTWVSSLKKLLLLTPEKQQQVHEGFLSARAAMKFTELTKEAAEELEQELKAEVEAGARCNGKLTLERVKRKLVEKNAEGGKGAAGARVQVSTKMVREAFDSLRANCIPAVEPFFDWMVDSGLPGKDWSDRKLANKIDAAMKQTMVSILIQAQEDGKFDAAMKGVDIEKYVSETMKAMKAENKKNKAIEEKEEKEAPKGKGKK